MFGSEKRLVVWTLSLGIAFLGEPHPAQASPCCASTSAAPALISGDEKALLGVSYSRASVIGDAAGAGSKPVFRSSALSEITQTYRLDGAVLLSDRVQTGVSLPLLSRGMNRSGASASSTDLGDIRLDAAYEALPEWDYSEWKPKGYAYLQFVIPTGKSKYQVQDSASVEMTGRGFYSIGAGSLLVKRWSSWDAFFIPELHYSFNRRYSDPLTLESTVAVPGWGGSLAIGTGFSPSGTPLRVGFSLQPSYQQPMELRRPSGTTRTSQQLSWDTSLDVTYLMTSEWSATGTYSDQTLMGPAVNSTLSRSFAVSLQHRWER